MGALSDRAKTRASQPKATKPERSPVREIQVQENKRFAKECQDHGCDGSGIAEASKKVNDKTYVVTPSGKPETWTEEEKQRQAIGKRKASDDIVAIGPQGTREVVKVAGDAAKEAKQLVNEHGVDAMWSFFFGKKTGPVEEPTIEADTSSDEPEFLTRAEQIRREEAANKADRLAQQAADTPIAEATTETVPDREEQFKAFFFF